MPATVRPAATAAGRRLAAPPTSIGRACLGFALLGWGLSILLGVVPHEDLLVGAGLTLFGAALAFTAPSWPTVRRLHPLWVGVPGGLVAVLVLAYDAWTGSPLNPAKGALVLFGAALALASPFLDRRLRLPVPGRPATNVASLVACALPVLGAPLAVYATQALFESAVGFTPVEAFLHYALLLPLAGFLSLLRWRHTLDGQTITYDTPDGPLVVEVGAACSGIQAMALFAAVLALYLVVERPQGRRLWVWCAIGLLGVYVANLLRLGVLAVVGYHWGGDALEQVHAQAGWMFFVGWALLFAVLVKRGARKAAPVPA